MNIKRRHTIKIADTSRKKNKKVMLQKWY